MAEKLTIIQRPDRLQAVIFDWAGTTVDYGCQGPVQAFVESFAAFGVPIFPEEARIPMGMKKRDLVAALCAMPRIAADWTEKHGHAPTQKDIDALVATVERAMVSTVAQYSQPITGVVETVQKMRSMGLAIGSCTGYPRLVGELLAARARERGYQPDIMVCASDVPHCRPAPDMCLEAMVRLGITAPARAVKIGDTVNDVLEGVRAGMWVIGLTLCGSMAGLSEDEMRELPDAEKALLHFRISKELLQAGAHFTAPDVTSCLPLLQELGLGQ